MAMDRLSMVYRNPGRHIGKLRVMSALLAACRPPGSLHGLAKEHDSSRSCDPHLPDVGEASAPHVTDEVVTRRKSAISVCIAGHWHHLLVIPFGHHALLNDTHPELKHEAQYGFRLKN